jgi:hypothetical protein
MKTIPTPALALAPLVLLATACTGGEEVGPAVNPPGAEESAKTDVLEIGAKAIQDDGPLAKMDVYLVGFHPMKDDPSMQMEAHHYCHQVNEDFAQCSLFDGNSAEANLTGVEYIISERLFEQLPAQERPFWHPHNGEILSGQLVAPSLPAVAEKELMRSKMNSYGKTWHTWHTRHGVQEGDKMPTGPASLAWSFSREGEVLPELVQARDERMDISTDERRMDRRDLVELARPQEGVDALLDFFPDARKIPGVSHKTSAAEVAEARADGGSAQGGAAAGSAQGAAAQGTAGGSTAQGSGASGSQSQGSASQGSTSQGSQSREPGSRQSSGAQPEADAGRRPR